MSLVDEWLKSIKEKMKIALSFEFKVFLSFVLMLHSDEITKIEPQARGLTLALTLSPSSLFQPSLSVDFLSLALLNSCSPHPLNLLFLLISSLFRSLTLHCFVPFCITNWNEEENMLIEAICVDSPKLVEEEEGKKRKTKEEEPR